MRKPWIPIRSVLAAAAVLIAAAGSAAADEAPAAAATPAATTLSAIQARTDYQISPGDTLEVAVFQIPDLSRTVQVDAGGKILLPLIGQVDTSGKTAGQLSQAIAADLGSKYVKDPQVTVTVKDSNSQKVTVDGAVVKPGIYPLTGPTTLLQAVALAEGPDPKRADTHKVAVLRPVNGRRETKVYNLNAIRDGKSPDPAVYPQDIVVVANSGGKSFLETLTKLAPFAFLIP
jgi:polysaccharide export outer membrane protein